MTSAARAISPHRFELVPADASPGLSGRLWLTIDHPYSQRAFRCSWDASTDSLMVMRWWSDDMIAKCASELEPGIVEALADFCRASDDVIELVNRYARES